MFKRIALLSATLITTLCALPTASYIAVNAEESVDSDVVINQSIEDDLATFNFDYTRYCLDKENYLHPVVITFKESKESKYYDLLYVYARLDPIIGATGKNRLLPTIEFNSVDVNYYYSDKMATLYDDASNERSNFKFIYSDRLEVNENGYIYRLAINEYNDYRKSNFREYHFTKLNYTTGLEKTTRKQNCSI